MISNEILKEVNWKEYDSIRKYAKVVKMNQHVQFKNLDSCNYDSSEEKVSLFISGFKTSSSSGRLGSFKLFFIIEKR